MVLSMALGGCFDDQAPVSDAGVDAEADVEDADTSPDADQRREIGESCTAPDQCVEGAACIGTISDEPEFICMKNCPEPGRVCDDGSICVRRLSQASSICYTGGDTARGESCGNNLDCGSGTLCFGTDAESYCLDACHELDSQVCPEGTYCHTDANSQPLCRSVLGARCASSDACADDLVCTEDIDALAGLFGGGYCTVDECSDDTDCPDGGVCRSVPDTQRAICLNRCASDGDCRFNQDYRCLSERYCAQSDRPDDCDAFRDGADVCFPEALIGGF
ncbi:MAG: hypothetical protein ACLFVJ_00305 [Persicimonas sp.]